MGKLISEEFLYKENIDEYLDALAQKNMDYVINNFIRLYGDEYLLRNDDRKIRFMEMQLKI